MSCIGWTLSFPTNLDVYQRALFQTQEVRIFFGRTTSRIPVFPVKAARSRQDRKPGCHYAFGPSGSDTDRHARIHRDMQNGSNMVLRMREDPRRSAGLGKRASKACASRGKIDVPPAQVNRRHACVSCGRTQARSSSGSLTLQSASGRPGVSARMRKTAPQFSCGPPREPVTI